MAKNPSRGRDGIESLSISELQAEINRRAKGLNKLLRRRQTLINKLAALDQAIVASGGSSGSRGGRASGGGLRDTIAKVLSGKTMSVTEIAEAVVKSGYVTTSPNFKVMVNQQLIGNKKLFKRVGRGQYSAS